MQNLFFFSGHNLSRKRKIQNSNTKTIQKQNKIKFKASHFAVETVGTSKEVEVGTVGPWGRGPRGLEGAHYVYDREEVMGWLGPDCSLQSTRDRGGVFCS